MIYNKTFDLSMGQIGLSKSQSMIHSSWKMCLHGRIITSVVNSNWFRHTQQVIFSYLSKKLISATIYLSRLSISICVSPLFKLIFWFPDSDPTNIKKKYIMIVKKAII